MADNILEIRHLSKSFGTHEVLRDIDFDVKKGDVISIIGASGSGKSTLLRCVNLLETPTSGDILYHGENVTGKSVNAAKYRSHVGMVFQSFNLFNNMTVLKNCMVGQMKVLGRSKAEAQEQAMRYLEKVGMAPYVNAKPRQLSGGQKQRVAIARTLAPEPTVLFMDEPLSNLDAKLRNQMRAEIIKLREKIDTTFIYVTHDQVEAMTLGDRIVIMRDGFIQQIGTPQEVFNHPANLFVAGFIGTPQMNFFEDCRLTKNGDAYSVTIMGHTLPLTAEQNEKLAAAGAESRTVTIGVRPVHVTVGDEGIDAQIDVSELMGSELHLHLAANGQDVVAVIPTANIDPMAYARHTAVKFGFDAKLVHLFDSDSEKNLI